MAALPQIKKEQGQKKKMKRKRRNFSQKRCSYSKEKLTRFTALYSALFFQVPQPYKTLSKIYLMEQTKGTKCISGMDK